MKKLFSGWVWLVMGLAISAVILSFAYFRFWAPDMTEAGYLIEHKTALETEGNKMPLAKKRVETAIADVNNWAGQWQAIVGYHTPPGDLNQGGINLAVTPYQLTVDSRKFVDSIQRAVNRQVQKGGVKIITGPKIPLSSDDPAAVLADFYNYPAAKYPVCVFELGTVTVEGSYQQITNHVRSWSDMPNYLAVTDGLAITGTGTKLRGTYNLVILAYIRGQQLPPSLTAAAPGPSAGVPGGNPTVPPAGGPARGAGAPPIGGDK